MRLNTWNRVVCSLMIGMIAWNALTPVALAQDSVRVPSGTPVIVKFPQSLSPKTLVPGQDLNLMVALAVKVEDKIVIDVGAPVSAEVVKAKKPGVVGAPAELHIKFNYVQAVDGTTIALNGFEGREGEGKVGTAIVVTILCCILGLLIKGGDVSIPAGTEVTAMTITEAAVTAQ